MDKELFLTKYLKFSGWLEIGIAVLFFFMPLIFGLLELPISPFFSTSAAVMLLILGFLLWYSAKDIERYTIIIISSCIFRYMMALGPELIGLLLIPILMPVWIFGFSYDILSATLTLILLKQQGYLQK